MARNKIAQRVDGTRANRVEPCAAPGSAGRLSRRLRQTMAANRLLPIQINARATPLAPVWGGGMARVVDIKPNETAPFGLMGRAETVHSLIAVSKQLVG